MKRGIELAEIPWLSCNVHTLQLCIQDAFTTSECATRIRSSCRKITGFFHKSDTALRYLHGLQGEANKAINNIPQDVTTRWSSTYHMLERLVENKIEVSRTLIEINNAKDLPDQLSQRDWKICGEMVELLRPFEEATRNWSAELTPTLPLVYPITSTLPSLITSILVDSKIDDFKSTLLSSLQKRFQPIKDKPLVLVACYLDPRFASKTLSGAQLRDAEYTLRQCINRKLKLVTILIVVVYLFHNLLNLKQIAFSRHFYIMFLLGNMFSILNVKAFTFKIEDILPKRNMIYASLNYKQTFNAFFYFI